MGIFDRFKGKRAEPQEDATQAEAAAAAAAAVSPTLDLTEAASAPSASKTFGFNPEEASTLYNPYEGLGTALDRRDVKAPFRVPRTPEFVFSEEALVHQRSWSENLTYYTGIGYLAGAIIGGGVGAYQALSAPVSLAGVGDGSSSQRLRVNQLLNTSGKLGRSSGNSLGVVGLFFASFESFFRHQNNGMLPDELPTLGSGAITGALYRSVRGPRQAAAAAVVGTAGAGVLLTARKLINPGM